MRKVVNSYESIKYPVLKEEYESISKECLIKFKNAVGEPNETQIQFASGQIVLL